jgi:hypothetical protein
MLGTIVDITQLGIWRGDESKREWVLAEREIDLLWARYAEEKRRHALYG